MLNSKTIELKMIIQSIQQVRTEWLESIDMKLIEILKANPNLDPKEAHLRALTHPEVHGKFTPLMNLYSVIGGEAQVYAAALDGDFTQTPLKRAA
jgi:hypothetical protein